MGRRPSNHANNGREMHAAVRRREDRRDRWLREGERSIWQNLTMIGALGWLIVVPTLLGVALGRWLDRITGQGITFTAALIVVGVGFGAYLAWKRVHAP